MDRECTFSVRASVEPVRMPRRHTETLTTGPKIRIKIFHRGEHFGALGKVANAQPNAGIGIVFTGIELNDQLVLDKWIAETRDK